MAEKIYNIWARRNPQWEEKYEESLLRTFCDYQRGVTQFGESRAKIFGAGYELFIVAFFIGLYYNRTKPLGPKVKAFGWSIDHWGNIEERNGRKAYPEIVKYMFAALVAKTDIDWLAVDKEEMSSKKAVDLLIDKMEQYANYGFSFMAEKLEEDPNIFYTETGFFDMFLALITNNATGQDESEDDEEDTDSLDDIE